MKTPEEIKKWLKQDCGECDEENFCPYMGIAGCIGILHKDALAYIRQLEAQNAELVRKSEQLERERDAAVNDLSAGYRCGSCTRYFGNGGECPGGRFCILGGFEWRGPCKENGGSDA